MRRLLFALVLIACQTTVVHPIQLNPGRVVADTAIKVVRKAGKPDSTGYLAIADAPIGKGQVVRFGYLDPRLRDSVMANRWKETVQNESGYCVTSWSILVQDNATEAAIMKLDISIDSTFVVWDMQPAKTASATAGQVYFDCPWGMPNAHVHPPNSCKNMADLNTCVLGGFSAYQCQPSEEDIMNIIYYGAPFGINICGPNQFRFYYPSDLLAHRWRGFRSP